jgi:hypothetical protein
MPLYPRDFIETTFLDEYREIIYTHKYYYIGFALVCIGVEFVGKCLDEAEQDWHKGMFSAKHFEAAIEKTMPRYKPHSTLLYQQLRSGFAHGLVPGPKVGLTHRAESIKFGTKHLSKHHDAVTVVIEDFYEDFEAACRVVLQRPFPENDKMNRVLLELPSDPVPSGRPLNTRTTSC